MLTLLDVSFTNKRRLLAKKLEIFRITMPCLSFTLILQISYLLAEDINYEIHFMVHNKIYDNRYLLKIKNSFYSFAFLLFLCFSTLNVV